MIDVIYFDKNIKIENNVACIGYFDGVHLGHQELINRTNEIANKLGLTSVLITFKPDPYDVINHKKRNNINSFSKRIKLFEKFGIQKVIVVPFDEKTMMLSPKEFKNNILDKLNIKTLVCGFDFTYGYMGNGNIQTLKKDGMKLCVIEEKKYYGKKISSTRIKEEINKGNIKLANRMLGYEYRK